MATQERLKRSLEVLKSLINTHYPDQSRKKDKIHHCYVITEAFSNPAIKISANVLDLFGSTVEVFLKLCDDNDSDVRMTSDECLNRITRAIVEGHMKVLIILLREINHNNSSRSLRAALTRFSQLCHRIKPQKEKSFADVLFPDILKISERPEEAVQETLATCLPRIIKTLGMFVSDNDLKVLLLAFLQNVVKESPAIRRSASSCIESICIHSKKPYLFASYSINYLLRMILPIDPNQSNSTILGVFYCLKVLLVHVKNVSSHNERTENDIIQPIETNKLLQIYELCIYYLKSNDHNILNSSLDTLSVLLLNAPEDLQFILLNPSGIDRSRIQSSLSINNLRSPSVLSIATNTTLAEEQLLSDLTDSIDVNIINWIDGSKLSVSDTPGMNLLQKEMNREESTVETPDYEASLSLIQSYPTTSRSASTDQLETLSDKYSEDSEAITDDKVLEGDDEFYEIDVGDYLDKQIPLLHCTRFIAKRFLLPGTPSRYTEDKTTRVSVKSSALTCLSAIFRMHPSSFYVYLDKNYSPLIEGQSRVSSQRIDDIMLLADHPDPQLRGIARSVAADLVQTMLEKTNLRLNEFSTDFCADSFYFKLENFIEIWKKGLLDVNSTCQRQTLISLKQILPLITESSECTKIIPLLSVIPTLVKNPYWLVKVTLCELASSLSYISIFHITRNGLFQQKMLYNVLFELLNDSDQRVRNSAAAAIVDIVGKLYSDTYHPKESIETTKGLQTIHSYFPDLNSEKEQKFIYSNRIIMEMPFPYNQLGKPPSSRASFFLSKIVNKLYINMLSTNSKNLINGCVGTLAALSKKYPCTVYKVAWGIKPDDNVKDLMNLCISMLNSSIHVYDINFMENLVSLSLNLFAGFATTLVKINDLQSSTLKPWSMFTNDTMRSISDQFLRYILKLLNIFHHVIGELAPVLPQSKTILPHLPSTGTLSPIKRRRSDDRKQSLSMTNVASEKENEKKESKSHSVGYFANSQHYMRIYEMLKTAFVNYKISLEPQASESLIDLMHTSLNALCTILEIGTINEFGKIVDNILTYLKSTFQLDSIVTIQCVQQLLKCLLETNLTACYGNLKNNISRNMSANDEHGNYSFYHNIFQKPYDELISYVKTFGTIKSVQYDADSTLITYLRRKTIRRSSTSYKSLEKILASYIVVLEPIVINSLKQYTTTSNVLFQCQVLKLLCQLVELGINYCLLDNDQIFKGFVLKQFERIEEGVLSNSDKIIPRIFEFLIQLSFAKNHSKTLIDIPKIIQLCDGLMASGQDPKTHCIPALEPIVEDVFLVRTCTNISDMKELETTREVVFAMLLRLFDYKEVIDLVTLVLENSKSRPDDSDTWQRWSSQVVNVFLNLLRQDKIRVDDRETFVALIRFVFALHPAVFQPPDDVVVMLFQTPPQTSDFKIVGRWLSKVIVLFFIISPLKEDELLAKINSVKAEFGPGSVFENFTSAADPLHVHNNDDIFRNVSAEVIIARLIFRIISIVSKMIADAGIHYNEFVLNQFSGFLIYCSHLFQTGSLCKVSQTAISLLRESDINVQALNRNFTEIKGIQPIITFQWCHILSVLNFNSIEFWNSIIKSDSNALNDRIVAIGGSIVFCDFLNENHTDTKQLSWVLSDLSENLLRLIDEVPVSEFISFVHRNAALSKMLIRSITQHCLDVENTGFKTKILKCVENCHTSQTGAVVKLLVPEMLNNRQTAISRMASNLACRKLEYLFTMSKEEILSQLPKEDLFIIKEELSVRFISKTPETLMSLFNKLLVQFYDTSPLGNVPNRLNTDTIGKLEINKQWLLSQIQSKYQDGTLTKETSKVMEELEYTELSSFMSSKDFNKIIFRDCIEMGVKLLKDKNLKEEPPILKAAIDNLLKEVSRIVNENCANHPNEPSHNRTIIQLCGDETIYQVQNICYSLTSLSRNISILPTIQLSEIDSDNFAKLAVTVLECTTHLLKNSSNLNVHSIDVLLTCASDILNQAQFCNYLGVEVNIFWLCSATDSLHSLLEFLLKDVEPLPFVYNSFGLKEVEFSIKQAQKSCLNLHALTSWMYQNENKILDVPQFLLQKIKSLVVSLGRIPVVNSYNLVPSRVWQSGWDPIFSGKFNTQVPALPMDVLQETDIFEEYIYRINMMGWTTRQQFEETWMCFLSVLCTPLDNLDSTEIAIARRASSLAVKSITALLLETLNYPILGNRNTSRLIHVSRNDPIPIKSISTKKLKAVQDLIENKFNDSGSALRHQSIENVFTNKNFEKTTNRYSYGQISIRYFLISSNVIEDTVESHADKVYNDRTKLLDESGLDVNSCLQFLLDYYTQLLNSESSMIDLRILHEVVPSILFISDLFMDKTQFIWLLDTFTALSKIHSVEDELIHQYLIIGMCKAAAVLSPDLEVYEQIKKLLVQFLRSPFLPTRISCLYGLLYLVEGCLLSNIAIGGISDELQLILPCACEYIQSHIYPNNSVVHQSQEHAQLVWSLAFYLIENIEETHMEANFVVNTLQVAIAKVSVKTTSLLDKSIIKGLERLLIVKPMYMLEKVGKQLQKLALDKMKNENSSAAIWGVQLLITYMYVDCWEHLDNPENEQSSPEHLVQTVEKISAIFELVKKSHIYEVKVLCSMITLVLRDFFSPSEILTQVIREFLSLQQPHPKLLSGVVFHVFDSAIELDQLSLLQDWVVYNLANFTQSSSNMSTWSLTCFFISASPNRWLKAFFPYVQNRVGRCDHEDRKIFCIAGSDFYKNLTSDEQRKTFVDSFVKVKDNPDMPFSDLLNSL